MGDGGARYICQCVISRDAMRRLADHCRQFDLPINMFRVPWQGVCGPVGDKGPARRLREMPSAPPSHCLGVHCLVFAPPHLRHMVLLVRPSGPYFPGIEDMRQNEDAREIEKTS